MRKPLSTPDAPAAIGPYSQGIFAEGSLLFLSGQIGLTPAGELVQGDVKVQTRQVMQNISAMLDSVGLSLSHVVKTTVFLSSMDHFQAMNEVYGSFFPSEPPARSTVGVVGLPRGVDVEIECIACY